MDYLNYWTIIPYRHEVENPVEILCNNRKELREKIEEQEKLIFEELGGEIALKKGLPKDYYIENKNELINLAYSETKKHDKLETNMAIGALRLAPIPFFAMMFAFASDDPKVYVPITLASASLLSISGLTFASARTKYYNRLEGKSTMGVLQKIAEQHRSYKNNIKYLSDFFVNDAWKKGYSEKEIINAFSNEEFTEEVQDMVRKQLLGIYYDEVEDGIARLDANIPERYRAMRNNISTEIANKKASISQDEQTL